jgi:hypothetical protein
MARSNGERVGLAPDCFVEGYRPFIIQRMDSQHIGQGVDKAQDSSQQRTRGGSHVSAGSQQWDTASVILSDWSDDHASAASPR